MDQPLPWLDNALQALRFTIKAVSAQIQHPELEQGKEGLNVGIYRKKVFKNVLSFVDMKKGKIGKLNIFWKGKGGKLNKLNIFGSSGVSRMYFLT